VEQAIIDRFWDKVDTSPDEPFGCWKWRGAKNNHGYGQIKIDGRVLKAHRVAYEIANGPIPRGNGYHGTCVCHSCDNPECINPCHLFLGSHADNHKDKAEKGRCNFVGEKNGRAQFTEDDVRFIRELNGTEQSIADFFGVGRSTIHSIRSGRTWSHV
jgi:hypothetical protein